MVRDIGSVKIYRQFRSPNFLYHIKHQTTLKINVFTRIYSTTIEWLLLNVSLAKTKNKILEVIETAYFSIRFSFIFIVD